jgi:hypothetical protein
MEGDDSKPATKEDIDRLMYAVTEARARIELVLSLCTHMLELVGVPREELDTPMRELCQEARALFAKSHEERGAADTKKQPGA